MGRFFDHATERKSLRDAWRKIRSNGYLSRSAETRAAIEMFDQESELNLSRIQRRMRNNEFEFDPQVGILKRKSSGGKRGIVMASVHNRVVERSLLDCLQSRSRFVKDVNSQDTSVGGVPHRSVPHGLKLIKDAFASGINYFVRSDISGFFDHIPRETVIERIARDIDDTRFISVLTAATRVVLANEQALGEDRHVFPTNEEGVAQGSPLSPLFGNILLYDFDINFNQRGIICIRFIDDFVLLSNNEKSAYKAFNGAKSFLSNIGLHCHDPFVSGASLDKASYGRVGDGFVFLGYDIRPGLFQPSRKARRALCESIDKHIRYARHSISTVKGAANSFERRERYAQTLVLLDRIIRGWGDAFAYSNASNTLDDLDLEIDKKLATFRAWFRRQVEGEDWKTKRRLGGVGLLGDIRRKSLDELPFILDSKSKGIRSAKAITVSTDGSIVDQGQRRGKDQGPGGWAFIVHGTDEWHCGRELSTTNNQMELRAVIEAIKSVDPALPIVVRTDSQYVCNAVNKQAVVRSNVPLWREFRDLTKSRKIKVVWVKGHNGDRYNERADRLAFEQAEIAKAETSAEPNRSPDQIQNAGKPPNNS